VNNTEYIM